METTRNCPQYVNTVRPRQCDRHCTDNVFKLIQITPNCIQTAPRFKNKFGSTLFQIESTSNILWSTQNDILQTNLKCIFLHYNCCIFLEISFKFESILDNFVNDVFKYFS